MIDQLIVGKRYRITFRARAFGGHLEGLLRSTELPRGALGNHDGRHCIWLSGELFEWFLRPEEIATIHEVADPCEARLSFLPRDICDAPLHPAGIRACLRRGGSIRVERVVGPRSCARVLRRAD